jgi:hypothetical protein
MFSKGYFSITERVNDETHSFDEEQGCFVFALFLAIYLLKLPFISDSLQIVITQLVLTLLP